jgi:hypothetical protein
VYRLFQLVALSTLLSLVVTFTLRNEALLAAWNKPLLTKRLLQFSPTHTEWVPTTALDYLLSVRSAVATNATPVFTSENLEELRAERHDLEGISDEAILSLLTREGYRVGYMDITEAYGNGKINGGLSDLDSSKMPSYATVNATAHPEFQRLVDMVSAEELKHIVSELSTSFRTRYYRSGHARGQHYLQSPVPIPFLIILSSARPLDSVLHV